MSSKNDIECWFLHQFLSFKFSNMKSFMYWASHIVYRSETRFEVGCSMCTWLPLCPENWQIWWWWWRWICQNCFNHNFTSGNSWSQRQSGHDYCNEPRKLWIDCHKIQLQWRFSQVNWTANLWALWGTISIEQEMLQRLKYRPPGWDSSLQVLILWFFERSTNMTWLTCTCIGCTYGFLSGGCHFYSFDSNLVCDHVSDVQLICKKFGLQISDQLNLISDLVFIMENWSSK